MDQSNANTTLVLRRSYRRHPRALRLPHPVKKGQVAWTRKPETLGVLNCRALEGRSTRLPGFRRSRLASASRGC